MNIGDANTAFRSLRLYRDFYRVYLRIVSLSQFTSSARRAHRDRGNSGNMNYLKSILFAWPEFPLWKARFPFYEHYRSPSGERDEKDLRKFAKEKERAKGRKTGATLRTDWLSRIYVVVHDRSSVLTLGAQGAAMTMIME